MIEIICDQYGLQAVDEGDYIVDEASQYEEALVCIKNHSQAEESLRVIVRNPVLFDWFDAAGKYGCKKCIIDPVADLANSLQVTALPKYLRQHPGWIAELRLLEKAVHDPILPTETADDWVKRILLGRIWQKNAPITDTEFLEFFTFFLSRKESSLHSLEKYLVLEHLQFWSVNNPEKSELFSWIKRDPFKRTRFIAWEHLLYLYPEARIAEWLQQDDIWFHLSQLPNRNQYLSKIKFPIQLPESIAGFVRSFLDEEWNSSPETALSFISGRLDTEKNFLLERLRRQMKAGVQLHRSVFDLIARLHNFPEVIDLARQLMPTKEPSILSEDSSISEIQDWLQDEYLPFYNSCALLNNLDLTKPFVDQFEHWLEKNYTGLLIKGEGMAYRQVSRLKKRLLDGPLLLVVFDGLDFFCAQHELLPAMLNRNFFPQEELIPFLSFLPTETFIAKPTLVCGRMKSQISAEIPKASFYHALLQDLFDLSEDDIRSATDKDASLQELIQEPAKVYLYLDNKLDREYLHENYPQYIRRKKYAEYMKKQAAAIVEAAEIFKEIYETSPLVLICSDHGYTVIPKNASTINVSSGKGVKARSLYLSSVDEAEKLDHELIWQLKPASLFGLNEEMAIPRGYSCFGKRPLGATHGGCTPQELVVPWFTISADKPEPLQPLAFVIEGEIFRKRKENQLTIKISNQNNYSVSITHCEIEGIDISSGIPLRIASNSIGEIQSSFNASIVNDSAVEFKVHYRLKSKIGELEDGVSLKVLTTGAMSIEFDDDFDF